MPATSTDTGFKKFVRYWLAVLLCMGVIFYFSSLPAQNIPFLFPLQDVLFHVVAYASLAYLFIRALKNTCLRLGSAKLILFSVVFGIIYGLSDEFHQSFVPGRNASAFDVFIDATGSLIGTLF